MTDENPTSYVERYRGYGWIKVKRQPAPDPAKSWEDRYAELDAHHVAETTFLINEVRRLASHIDDMRGAGDRDPSPVEVA